MGPKAYLADFTFIGSGVMEALRVLTSLAGFEPLFPKELGGF